MLMCSEKFSLESIVTPNNLKESVILISSDHLGGIIIALAMSDVHGLIFLQVPG